MSTDKGRYSRVSRRVWNDASFRKLSQPKPCAAWLFFRLLTGPELSRIPGLFQAWEAGIAQALGWQLKDFRKAWREIERQGLAKADWKTGLVWLPKAIRHNEPENPNNVASAAWKADWAELPDCPLKLEAADTLLEWAAEKGPAWVAAMTKVTGRVRPNVGGNPPGNVGGERYPQRYPQPPDPQDQEQDQEQEQEQEQDPPNPPRLDLTDSETETPIPMDLAERAERHGVLQDWARKSGASLLDCRAAVDEFVTYWTIGGGSGRRRNRWLSRLREHLKDLHERDRLVGFAKKSRSKTEPEHDSGDVLAEINQRLGYQA